MTKRYLFADEAGCFTFSRAPNVSKYFIICTVTLSDLSVSAALASLRHDLVLKGGEKLGDYFHATVDSQAVRDAVFSVMMQHEFRIQATICEKAKAQPQVRQDKARFYKYPWFYHMKFGIARHLKPDDDLIVTAASIGSKKEKMSFSNAITDVAQQTVRNGRCVIDFRPSSADPCLQVADYAAWAIQRKWERGDARSYAIIKDRITYEYDLWEHGSKLYY